MRESTPNVNEQTPLLPSKSARKLSTHDVVQDVENQKMERPQSPVRLSRALHNGAEKCRKCVHVVLHPKTWEPRMIWDKGILHPVSLLPAVFLGLLLNILDALSYGTILFPLGQSVFEDLGADGIAMFYVSTIIAQLTYSSGGSIFRVGIGSEMIEVVPFFHKMAFTILTKIGEDNPKSVLATTILSFSISSILTGVVFFLMGACRLG